MARKPTAKAPPAPVTTAEGVTLRQLLDRALRGPWADVKSFTTLNSNVKFLNERLGDHLVAAINADVLENFTSRMRAQGYAMGTVKRRLDTLSRALTLAVRWGYIAGRPVLPELKVSNLKERVLSREEQHEVYSAIRVRQVTEHWRPWHEFERLVTVLLQTGGRLGEVLGLVPNDISEDGYLTFRRGATKNDKPRTIPLTDFATQALEPDANDTIFTFTPVKAAFFWSIIRKDVGGIDDVTLHTLRHTALTRLARGGMDILRLQKWAGHSDPRITAERYTHLMPSDLDAGRAILESTLA